MLSSLTGTIADLTAEGTLTVQVGPIALDVLVPRSLLGRLATRESVTLATHLQVSDDALTLFGFASVSDRAFFRQLLSVTGVGPKSALAILALEPSKVREAVLSKDLATLGAIPGLGKKRAQRLILELANALAEDDAPPTRAKKAPEKQHPLHDVLAPALEKLGYAKDEIRGMLAELPGEIDKPEAALQHILKHAR